MKDTAAAGKINDFIFWSLIKKESGSFGKTIHIKTDSRVGTMITDPNNTRHGIVMILLKKINESIRGG